MKSLFLLSCFVFLLTSCKKNELGGSSTIKGTVIHHANTIAGARVFIKFNAKEFPGEDTTKYDGKVISDMAGKFTIKCYKGDYYLFAVGFDKGFTATGADVKGGVPVKMRKNETREIELALDEKH